MRFRVVFIFETKFTINNNSDYFIGNKIKITSQHVENSYVWYVKHIKKIVKSVVMADIFVMQIGNRIILTKSI